MIVLQSSPLWLPLTSPWLYNQVRYLPASVTNHIVCERTANLDQFALPRIHSFESAHPVRRVFDKLLRRSRVRHHLGYVVAVGRKSGAQLVHSHWGDFAWRDMGAVKRLDVPHVVTFYGKDVNYLPHVAPFWRSRYQTLFDTASLFLCEGPHMGSCLVDLGCPVEKVAVHHLGVDVPSIQFCPRSWDGRRALKVLIAASFREKKGIPDALEALAMLIRDGIDVDITLIGDASEDPRSVVEKHRIDETIARHDLAGRIHAMGYQPYDVFFREAYANDVFLSPSKVSSDGDTEGGAPVSLIDVAATGMPIVSTTHCDIPEVVKPSETGWLADEGDVSGIHEQLRALVARPERWFEVVAAGRAHIEAEYDVAVQGTRLAEHYGRLL